MIGPRRFQFQEWRGAGFHELCGVEYGLGIVVLEAHCDRGCGSLVCEKICERRPHYLVRPADGARTAGSIYF